MRPVQLYLMTCGPEHGLDGAGQYAGQAVKFLQGSGANGVLSIVCGPISTKPGVLLSIKAQWH